MSAHTQGPWHRNIAPAHKYPTIFAGRNTHIAKIVSQGIGVSECEANLNLIVAAPDLLAALEVCAERLRFHMKHTEDLVAHMQACKAIDKAMGVTA